jgi:predicted O-methyltransferase YrrM
MAFGFISISTVRATMTPLRDETIARMIEWIGPPTDEIVAEMEDWAAREGFSTVGPEVGRMLALCARLLGARDVFGLGFGFGYSAYWIVRTLPAGGRFVLTERDADVLGAARSAFERGDLADRAVFEGGNAIETAEKYDHQGESFDLVVLDHDSQMGGQRSRCP